MCFIPAVYTTLFYLFLSLMSLTSQLVNANGIPYVCAAFCYPVISMTDLMMTT